MSLEKMLRMLNAISLLSATTPFYWLFSADPRQPIKPALPPG